jgi:N-acetylneuraminic acid mutarotase
MNLFRKSFPPIALAILVAFAIACGGGGGGGGGGGSSAPPPAPVATSLTAEKTILTAGSSTTLTPVFSNGTGVITPGNISATSGVAITVTPTSTTTYTLTVTNSVGAVAGTVATITVVPPPVASSLTAKDAFITAGTVTELTPVFSGGTGIVTPGNLAVTSGVSITVAPSVTTTYTLTVTNAAGTVATTQSFVSVTPAPIATSLTPNASAVTVGNGAQITPIFSNGTATIGITNGGSEISTSVTSGVAINVFPATFPYSEYYLTVTNVLGAKASTSTKIYLFSAPQATSLTSSEQSISFGTPITLTPVFSNGTGVITPGNISATSGVAITVTPTSTTTYTLTVTNGAGTSATKSITINLSNVFNSPGSLTAGRNNHTATLLPNGKVLITGGAGLTLNFQSSTELYEPSTGVSSSTGSLATGRNYHTATLLPNGKVLVAGGLATSPTDSCELYDPSTGAWSSTGSLITGRYFHTATLLPNGKVLVVGGQSVTDLSSCLLYDPSTGTWSGTGSLNRVNGLAHHTATLLPNGKVLVVGDNEAQLYDSSTGQWSSAGLIPRRYNHTATLLPNGKVLIAGGNSTTSSGGSNTSTAELYDIYSGTWSTTESMATARRNHTATLLRNGKVLVAGGESGSGSSTNTYSSAELYDPSTGSWSSVGSLINARSSHSATLLPNGRILVAGGGAWNIPPLSTTELFLLPSEKNINGKWAISGSMTTARHSHSSILLPNGKVLVAGGAYGQESYDQTAISSAELYNPDAGTWSLTGSLNIGRYNQRTILLPNGKVLVAGGSSAQGVESSCELYDPSTGAWSSTGSLLNARMNNTATLLPNGKVLVTGGYPTTVSCELYDPSTGAWSSTGSLLNARVNHTATLLPNGKVLVVGGNANDGVVSSAELYDPTTGVWSPEGSLLQGRFFHYAHLLPTSGKVLVAGGRRLDGVIVNYFELYDPDTRQWSYNGPAQNYNMEDMAGGAGGEHSILLGNGILFHYNGSQSATTGQFLKIPFPVPFPLTWSSEDFASWNFVRGFWGRFTLLPNGKLLGTGGLNRYGTAIQPKGTLSSAELYSVQYK